MPTDSRFRPCPFCGNKDIHSDRHPDDGSPTGSWFSMCCYKCGATRPNCASINPMIVGWNRRVGEPARLCDLHDECHDQGCEQSPHHCNKVIDSYATHPDSPPPELVWPRTTEQSAK